MDLAQCEAQQRHQKKMEEGTQGASHSPLCYLSSPLFFLTILVLFSFHFEQFISLVSFNKL
jgi:hypothetical protein